MTVLGVERTGPDDAPNVAWILHGILGSARNWTTFARRMADEARWRIVRPMRAAAPSAAEAAVPRPLTSASP